MIEIKRNSIPAAYEYLWKHYRLYKENVELRINMCDIQNTIYDYREME